MTRSSLHAPERVLDPAALQGMDERWADLLRQRDELLAALKDLTHYVAHVEGPVFDVASCADLCGRSDCHNYGCVPLKLQVARAAIAKAEGR